MTDTTKFASPVNDVMLPSKAQMKADAKSAKAEAKLKAKQAKLDARHNIDDVGDSTRGKRGPLGAGAGLLAAATAVRVLIWRKQRKPRTPREKMARAWRDAKSRAGDVKTKVKKSRIGR